MKALVVLLGELQRKLDRFRKEGLKETPTRTIFIDPLLKELGWDVRDPDEAQLEYPTVDGKSVDYALKINVKPILLVEAKPLNDPLTDVKDVTQITGYAANDGIVWCILTNGVRWRVYRSVEQCPAPEKLMFEVSYDLKDMEGMSLEQVAEQFQRFSREAMAKGVLDALGEQTFTDGKIRKALRHLVADPPSVLLKMVRRATGDASLRPQVVKESLRRVLLPFVGTSSIISGGSPQNIRKRTAAKKLRTVRRTRGDLGYSEDLHTNGKPQEVLELYQKIDQFCLGLQPGAVRKRYLAKIIAYSVGKRTFCSLHLLQGGMRVWLNTKYDRLSNPPDFSRDVSNVGHWGIGSVELAIANLEQLALAEPLIRQCLDAK
jgi:predicted transport protein